MVIVVVVVSVLSAAVDSELVSEELQLNNNAENRPSANGSFFIIINLLKARHILLLFVHLLATGSDVAS